jgi:hypothetical protein
VVVRAGGGVAAQNTVKWWERERREVEDGVPTCQNRTEGREGRVGKWEVAWGFV